MASGGNDAELYTTTANRHFTVLRVKGNNMTENKNLENLPVPGEEQWELEERMKIHHSYSKSRYPPMCIEPVPYERQRLNGQGMTPEERALRKQWLLDQYLKPHEPPNSVEALETMNLPVNPIKRMFRMPMDVTFRMLTPVIGKTAAVNSRRYVPSILKSLVLAWAFWYHVKYHPNTWEHTHGWAMFGEKPATFGYKPPDKKPDDFMDRGFKARTALRDGKTSFNSDLAC